MERKGELGGTWLSKQLAERIRMSKKKKKKREKNTSRRGGGKEGSAFGTKLGGVPKKRVEKERWGSTLGKNFKKNGGDREIRSYVTSHWERGRVVPAGNGNEEVKSGGGSQLSDGCVLSSEQRTKFTGQRYDGT